MKKTKTPLNIENELKELNHKQILFCEEYIKTLNATKSYLGVYKCKYNTARTEGSKLLAQANIQKYIEERLAKTEKKKIADADEILTFLTDTLRGKVKDQLGFETSVKDRIKAGELLARRYNLFEDKKSKNDNGSKITPKISLEIVDNSNLESVLFENRESRE